MTTTTMSTASTMTTTTDPMTGLDWTFRAMGTRWRIHHAGGVSGAAAQAFADRIAEDERRWSRFLTSSETNRITRGAGSAVPVSDDTIDLVQSAIEWSRRTNGAFDPLVGAAMTTWGYATSGRGTTVPPPSDTDLARLHVEGTIDVDANRGTVAIPAGTALDLGGIGKSWSAVRAGDWLAAEVDDERLIVDAGGDLAIVRGSHTIATEAGPIRAAEGTGVATSSSERRRWTTKDGADAHHLIDPGSSRPSRRATAVVAGVDPVAADALASAVVIDPGAMRASDAAIAVIDTGGRVETNDQWAALATMEGAA